VEVVVEQSRFLQFVLGEYQLLFPLAKLQEIFNLNLNQVTAVPGLDSYVMGIYNWRGSLAWLIDLQELLTGSQTNFNANCLCMLTPLKGQYLGIVIDRVGGISSFGGNEMQPVVTPMIEPIGSNFIQGYFLDEHNQPLFVLDSQGIINSFIHL
jgi:positive phototaxis protein PixI